MSYKLKDIIYNADGYYPVFETDKKIDEKYKINNIEQKKDIESKIKIVLNDNIKYTMDNIKDYLHR